MFVVTGNPSLALAAFQLTNAATNAAFLKAPRPEQATSSIRTERPPRVSAYGRSKLFGAYAIYTTNSGGVAVDVWAFHQGRVDAIEEWYLGDKKVTRLPSGFVSKAPDKAYGDNKIRIGANLGATPEVAHAAVMAALPGIWTEQHRGDGVVSGYMISSPVKSKDFQEVYPSGGPNAQPLGIVARWQRVFDWRDEAQDVDDPETWAWSENPVLHLAHYQLVRNGKSWERHFLPTLAYWTAAADDCDRLVPLASGTTHTAADSDGATIIVESATGIVPGAMVTIGASGPYAETGTVATVSGGTITLSAPLARVWPSGSLVSFASPNSETEPRYRGCVSHRHAGDGSEHKAVLAAILGCFDGWMAVRDDGALVVHSGRYYEPTAIIGPDLIVSYTVDDGVEDENALNQVNVTYVSAAHDFNTVDTDPVIDEGDILARGQLRVGESANQVPSATQARRLARRKMKQAMAPKRGTVVTREPGRIMAGERFVRLRLIEGEGQDHEFVAFDGAAEITGLSRNLQTGAWSASWIAADASIDDDVIEVANEPPAVPVGEREPLVRPIITAATAELTADSGAGLPGAFLRLSITGPDREDLQWSARTRIVGAAVWGEREYSDLDPGALVQIDTEFVPTDEEVEAQVQYQVADGRFSEWSESVIVSTSTEDVVVDYDGGDAAGNPTPPYAEGVEP